jgi:uncharacterized protein YbjT (DUF2867 family)
MSELIVLAVGATGSIGRLVVDEALRLGLSVRALVRDAAKARSFPDGVKVVIGDVTRPETLADAVVGIDAVVFTLGSDGAGKRGAEAVDYGGVRNVLRAIGASNVRIALMTSIGITNRTGDYNRRTEAHDWKRRSERLVRVSGRPYTIVSPGWFDYNKPNQQKLIMLQGDRRQAGDPSDGVVARRQIAETLVRSLVSPHALSKTFELVSENGPKTQDFETLFSALASDEPRALDGVADDANMPVDAEPERVNDDLESTRASYITGSSKP